MTSIAVALDVPDVASIRSISRVVAPHVSTLKIGLETFLRDGRDAVDAARLSSQEAGHPCDIFLDLKLHDIPNTVAGAVGSVADIAPRYLTVHATGGAAMIRAAAQVLPTTLITAVTVLTSLSQADLTSLGWTQSPKDLVKTLADVAVSSGARALVCSPQEVAMVRSVVGDGIVLITPGVRPAGTDVGDQARVATPEQAAADGADLLVIGRPITGASDPGAAAAGIAETLKGASA